MPQSHAVRPVDQDRNHRKREISLTTWNCTPRPMALRGKGRNLPCRSSTVLGMDLSAPKGQKAKTYGTIYSHSQIKSGTSNPARYLDGKRRWNHMLADHRHLPASPFSHGGYPSLSTINRHAPAATLHVTSHIEKVKRRHQIWSRWIWTTLSIAAMRECPPQSRLPNPADANATHIGPSTSRLDTRLNVTSTNPKRNERPVTSRSQTQCTYQFGSSSARTTADPKSFHFRPTNERKLKFAPQGLKPAPSCQS